MRNITMQCYKNPYIRLFRGQFNSSLKKKNLYMADYV